MVKFLQYYLASEVILCVYLNPKVHMSAEMDVSSQESISKGLADILSKYQKPPSIIVNSAGITRDNFLLKMSESDFDAVVNVNLKVLVL